MRPVEGIPPHTPHLITPGVPERSSLEPPPRSAWPEPGGPHSTPHPGAARVRVLVRTLQPGSASRRAREVIREVLEAAGVADEAVSDAELIVAELAANAERHGRPPYELRIFTADGVPAWGEIVDGDPDTHEVALILNLLRSVREIGLPLLAENGRGLLLAHRLSGGRCHVHSVALSGTGAPGKAVAFALPAPPEARRECRT
ncbi:hypothetical protein Sme01_20230 [Sphaerisporangium melleum]|uniref:Histidine kinase/HSP90-like ATPase domain-containing protein n=1 Tax=Sphaerisporangium melleum TaxID=321316 RepID=A0A917RKQ5_9ACTN|nr:ATP-binding protein [Sphaerisporangium melleum]GGL13039.1 hypothetical protein GCM10007964_63940 [Sphaerisporangium melleum]GII69547.1 hypothetical protein Sme01_20230 [Sphaerisporangium melleum]